MYKLATLKQILVYQIYKYRHIMYMIKANSNSLDAENEIK